MLAHAAICKIFVRLLLSVAGTNGCLDFSLCMLAFCDQCNWSCCLWSGSRQPRLAMKNVAAAKLSWLDAQESGKPIWDRQLRRSQGQTENGTRGTFKSTLAIHAFIIRISTMGMGWLKINCLHSGGGHFCSFQHKWGLAPFSNCKRGAAEHIISQRPTHRAPQGISGLKVWMTKRDVGSTPSQSAYDPRSLAA